MDAATAAGLIGAVVAGVGAMVSSFQWLGVRPPRCLPCQTLPASDPPPPNDRSQSATRPADDFRIMDLTHLYRRQQTKIGALDNSLSSLKMEIRRMFGVAGIVFLIGYMHVLLLLIFPEESRKWLLSIKAIMGVWGHTMFGAVLLRLVVFGLCPNFTEGKLLGSVLSHLFAPLRRALDRMNETADPPAPGPPTPPARAGPRPPTPPARAGPPEVDSAERLVRSLEVLAKNQDQDGSAGRFVKRQTTKVKFVADQLHATATALTQLSPSGANSARSRSVPQTRPGRSLRI